MHNTTAVPSVHVLSNIHRSEHNASLPELVRIDEWLCAHLGRHTPAGAAVISHVFGLSTDTSDWNFQWQWK